jgi:hypothetical protein
MAQRTFSRMYDRYDEAESVVTALETAGIPHSDISLVANADAHGRRTIASSDKATSTGAGTGAVAGTAVGGGLGLLAGIGALAIPGVGPVVAAGWLVATLAGAGVGAGAGGLVGSLTGSGIHKDEANVYAEGVKRGGSLVSVRADEARASEIESILGKSGSADWQTRRSTFGTDWRGVDEAERPSDSPPNLSGGSSIPPSGRV